MRTASLANLYIIKNKKSICQCVSAMARKIYYLWKSENLDEDSQRQIQKTLKTHIFHFLLINGVRQGLCRNSLN